MLDFVYEAADPLARSMFWRVLAEVYLLAGEYASALLAVDNALLESDDFHLAFVRPHSLISRILALTGLNRLGAAHATLSEVESTASTTGDQYLIANAAIARSRLHLREGSPEKALAAVRMSALPRASLGRRGEYGATRAIALVAAGEPAESRALVNEFRGGTGWLGARLLLDWADAISALVLDEPKAPSSIQKVHSECVAAGARDTIALALHACPEVATTLALRGVDVDEAHETNRLESRVPQRDTLEVVAERTLAPLTRREREVLNLLAQGHTNREIAQDLVISETTAKVHVRHILEKLRVRNRTEAARLASTGRLSLTDD
jgi:ATP/maltotriose-dependent transcriptional regulator MalT